MLKGDAFSMLIILCCFLVLILSYLIGSLNFSILISKFFLKENITNLGSKNAGATNMLRMFGKKFAAFTFLGDFLKGSLCVMIANIFGSTLLNSKLKTEIQMFALVGVVLGHIFPIFFNFKGGKGIATAAGTILLIDYKIFIVVIMFFLIVLALSKIVSLSSVLTVIFYAIFNAIYYFIAYKLTKLDFSTASFQIWFLITIKSTFLSFIIIAKHSKNIKRLINRTEPKIGR